MNQIEIALEEFQRQLRLYDIFRQYHYDLNFYYDQEDNRHNLKAYSFLNGVIDGITCMMTDQHHAEQVKEIIYEYLDTVLKAHFKMHSHAAA